MLERIGEELGRFTDELAVERSATRLILQARCVIRVCECCVSQVVVSDVSAPIEYPAKAVIADI